MTGARDETIGGSGDQIEPKRALRIRRAVQQVPCTGFIVLAPVRSRRATKID